MIAGNAYLGGWGRASGEDIVAFSFLPWTDLSDSFTGVPGARGLLPLALPISLTVS